jgi:hypothetical protein
MKVEVGGSWGWVFNATPRKVRSRKGWPEPGVQEQVWPRGRAGRCRKSRLPVELETLIVQPVARSESLNRLRYSSYRFDKQPPKFPENVATDSDINHKPYANILNTSRETDGQSNVNFYDKKCNMVVGLFAVERRRCFPLCRAQPSDKISLYM